MTEIDDFDLAITRDFITHEWFYFIEFNDRRSDDGSAEAERIYQATGGE